MLCRLAILAKVNRKSVEETRVLHQADSACATVSAVMRDAQNFYVTYSNRDGFEAR